MRQATRSRRRTSRRTSGSLAGLVVLTISAAIGAAIAAPTPPEGIWYTKDEESIIKVHPCAEETSHYCGTIVWLKEPKEADGSPKVDKLNKDPAKKNKPLVGLDILLGMTADEDHWTGKAYNPDDGKVYDITFKVKTEKEENDTADLRGCVLKFLCQTETFTRAKDVPGGDPTADGDAAPSPVKKHKKKQKESADR